jgi:hypothetical protein
VTLAYYGLWMLCGIGTAVLAADGAHPRRNLILIAAGFAAGAVLLRVGRLPDVTWIAGATAAAAALLVVRPTPASAATASIAAGLIAAVWASLLQGLGVSTSASMLLAPFAAVCSAVLAARSRAFAPERIRDEALLLVTALGIVLAVAPGMLAGWQSAGALNLEGKGPADVAAQSLPGWTILMTLGAASLGGAYSVWTRR